MRIIATLAVAVSAVTGAAAQAPRPAQPAPPVAPAPPAPPAATVVLGGDAREVRQQLRDLLMKFPPEVGRILKMDPTMLTNQQYLAQYPAVQQYLAAHPEVARNPGFYLQFVDIWSDYTQPTDSRTQLVRVWADLLEGAGVLAIMAFVSAVLAWLLKTVLNHRRWLRTSRVMTETHTKLLDRFANTDELMKFTQTSAGRRFLEAAPIHVEAAPERPIAAPISRILWAVQAGIVLVVGGVGFQFVSGRVIPEVAEGLWMIGVLASAFGVGFILSGAFSFVMSKRLGLLEPVGAGPDRDRTDDRLV